jgi:hypothetical protein
MAHSRVADGEDGLKIWRIVANILDMQSRAAHKEWSYSLGVGRGANNFCYEMSQRTDSLDT